MRDKRGDIQGLRGVAVGLVLLFHAGIPGFAGGFIGVDVFFVISGFLISTHLVEELRNTGRLRVAEFYARRARRLLPAALTVIALTVVTAFALVPPMQFAYVAKDAVAAILYVPNLLFARRATDYLADRTPSLFLHYWSLGVEEQFYLFWPLLLFIFYRVFKDRGAPTAIAVLGAGSFVLCVWLTFAQQPYAFFLLPARVWEFSAGAVAAFVVLKGHRMTDIVAAVAGWTGLAAIVGSGCMMPTSTPYPGYAAALPVVGAAAVIWSGASKCAYGPQLVLGLRPITFVGDISYSLYLIHWPALVIPAAITGYMVPLQSWQRAVIAAACVPVAWLLYRYVELPGQRMPWLKLRPRRSFAAATVGMLAVAALIGSAALASRHPRLDAGRAAADTAIEPIPMGTPFVPSNLQPSLVAVAADIPIIYRNECHVAVQKSDATGCAVGPEDAPRVVLFGDSHAAQWYPALNTLAEKGMIRLESHTKRGCSSVQPIVSYAGCAAWASNVVDQLNADPPALIILSNFGRGYGALPDPEAWREAINHTVAEMPQLSKVAVLADTPSTGANPKICLSGHLDAANQCALPRALAVDPAFRASEREAAGITYLDYIDYFCNQQACPSIIGNTLVYRDGSHMSRTYSAELAKVIEPDIAALLSDRD